MGEAKTRRQGPRLGLAGFAVLDTVDRGDRPVLERALEPVHDPLQPVEPSLHAPPAGGDELDEEGEILDPGSALGVEVGLEALEPADGLAGEPSDFGDVPSDREDFRPERLVQGGADPVRHRRLELGRGLDERLELLAGPLQRRLDGSRLDAALSDRGESPAGPVQRVLIHARGL